jgi:hypothetical protein
VEGNSILGNGAEFLEL